MQLKTKGIVLHSVRYSDTATIVTIYTEQFGRASYMVYGVNKKKAVFRSSFLQPLSLVDLDVVHTPSKDIQRIKDIRISVSFTEIPFNPLKNSIALFVSEVLFRTLRQSEADEELFNFLEKSVQYLDCCEEGVANFHLIFLLRLTRFLGCAPNREDKTEGYFDLVNGVFLQRKPLHTHYIARDISGDLLILLQSDYKNMNVPVFSRKRRIELLESLVEYYRLHIPDFNGLNSLEVLQSLFD